MLNLRKNKNVYWVAILAILFITLAPLMSQASSSSNELEGYDVICSSSGIKLVNNSDSNDASDTNTTVYCSYCSLSAEKPTLNSQSFIDIQGNYILGKPTMIPGSQGSDQNGCVIDGGYTWCESSQRCIRIWEEECESLTNICDGTCPPPAPCPLMAVQPGCRMIPPTYDSCGCSIGCGTIDCSTVHNVVGEGGSCGGFMMNQINTCDQGLECVNIMGPMIADAPGTCMTICNTERDQYGNCLNQNNNLNIPWNCASWYDGCNTCSVVNGVLGACTLMMCFTNNEPHCQTYYSGELRINDVCYRFCEDNSKSFINRRNDCPKNSECVSENNNMISFDSCSNTMRCISTNGH